MKKLGIIGGMSWQSTVSYYQWLNQGVQQALGGLHSASVILHSVDFAQIEQLQQQQNWQACGTMLADIAVSLEQAGAESVIIATNTMHIVADQVQQRINIPLLHIADGTASALNQQQISHAVLLGTRYTMEGQFLRQRLTEHGISISVPDPTQQQDIQQIIYQELCQGQISTTSRQRLLDIIQPLITQGAQGVILGCTELGLLLRQQDTQVPLVDTTRAHVDQALLFMLS